MKKTAVIIPALNEESSVAEVVAEIPSAAVGEIVVVNNGSTDRTASNAREAGATVIDEPVRGYGRACLTGIEYIKSQSAEKRPEIAGFLDADHSDYPSEIPLLLEPILRGEADLVIGSRIPGNREPGSIPPHAVFGNKLAVFLIRRIFGAGFSDLGPFRAITVSSLTALEMRDEGYGWTVEMQIKAVKKGLRCKEIPVRYRKRTGVSKISGTVPGSIKAGAKILWTIFKHA